ncbi:hypothetical protein D3C74_215730 [compost metagenome]
MGSSFLSERSAEYVLIPKFYESLLRISNRITPIYFWATREGASYSKSAFKGRSIAIVALYARRPKIQSVDSEVIELKFNSELFARTAYLASNGISVFAGAPLITKLEDLNLEADCKWFTLLPTSNSVDEYVGIDKTGRVINKSSKNIKEVTTNEIVDIVEKTSRNLSWESGINILKNNKYNNQNTKWYFGAGYKPVYFVLDISEKR